MQTLTESNLRNVGKSADAPSPSLNRFAVFTAGSAFFLLFAGGLVTSTGSGLAVPDWPLSFGTLFPEMTGGVFFEHGHRLIAGAVAILTFVLAGWVLKTEDRPFVRGLAVAAGAGILLQALLGGLTVLLKLPPAVSMTHAILGQTVFCVLLAIADMTRPSSLTRPSGTLSHGERGSMIPPSPKYALLFKSGALALGALYIQLFLGAYTRHTGQAVALHALWSLGVTAHIGSLVARTFKGGWNKPSLTRPATLLSVLVPLQLVLGLATWALRGSVPWHSGFNSGAFTATVHLAIGAAILGATSILTLRAWKLR